MVQLVKLVAKLTPQLKAALENAVGEAVKRKTPTVEAAHWLYHVVFGNDADLQTHLEGQGLDMSVLQKELEGQMPYGSAGNDNRPTISGSVSKLIEEAWLVASVDLGHVAVLPEVLLLASLQPNALGLRSQTLKSLSDISTDKLRTFAAERGDGIVASTATGEAAAPRGAGGEGALARFTVNLTQAARDGALDPVLGRTEEISKSLDVLLRKRQNNPILLGLPGVGKTAIVEGLAQKIVAGDVPEQLQGAELLSLDMGLLQAGASVKGEFEERLKNVLAEVKSSQTPILMFIDEAHTMIGAGGAEGQNDAANLLKPALARGEFRTVAATTYAEYKKYFEKDPALSRRFQPIDVDEPKPDVAVNILRAVADNLSLHHNVLVQEEAIKAAVALSVRFMPARRLPDKAISLMDTACARVALSQHSRPQKIEFLEEQLRFAEVELQRGVKDAKQFGRVEFDGSDMEGNIAGLKADLDSQVATWDAEKDSVASRLAAAHAALEEEGEAVKAPTIDPGHKDEYVYPWVTEATIAAVVSDWTGVPVSSLEGNEAQRLLTLENTLKERVIGQGSAIDAIARSLKISRAGLTDTRKPIGVFLMCGPSGVGKTETALAIAEQVFGGEGAITTINMTEFKEAHKSSMLLGAAAGYVGYGKGGVLTEAIRRKPYSVLLLDEMEKAHPAIHDIFFQIFDKGNISDSEGQNVDFRNTIIIMTSNAGGEEIRDFVDGCDHDPTSEELTARLRPTLLNYFSPAFIGRTEVIAYRPLSAEVSGKLTELHLNRIKKRIALQYGAEFGWNQSFVNYVVSANNDPLSGGRALEAIINKNFLPRLAERCIEHVIDGGTLASIHVGHDGNEVTLEMA
jgi:type VI secretion system protein VasG